MKNRSIRALLGAAVLVPVLWVAIRGAGPVPPLGQLLDPANGAWGAALYSRFPAAAAAKIPGLRDSVDVRYDDRGVPHIFAKTESDAFRAFGYVVARDRLFQLDLQTHAAAGRLTEWAGARALVLDRQMRDLGLPRAAEQTLAAVDTSTQAWHAMLAFSDGVNAYIDGLSPAQWPVEYRLLGARPERWTPINTFHLLNRMAWTLAYLPDEGPRYAARAMVGDSAADAIFPANSPIQEPIQPTGGPSPQFNFGTIPPPGAPDTAARVIAALLVRVEWPGEAAGTDPHSFASNNWAVAPSKSADGHALLANDPHLGLTLPSIWYETQMVVPGKLDVYGVTIPGLPGVVLGFNRDVAWGFTNTGADVLDFYSETVDDATHPAKYKLDGDWKPLELRVEVYHGTHGEVIATDTVRYTHRGPLMHRFGQWVSMRWTALEPSDEAQALYDASHAASAKEFLDDMARGFFAPAQNMIVADRAGNIGIRSTGHFPIRPKGADGLTIFDGSTSASDWRGFWPVDKYPQAMNPAQGYLASANQQPVDPSHQFAYIGDDRSFDPWRALDINQLLRGSNQVSADMMRQLQVNPLSVRAQKFAPFFVQAASAPSVAASLALQSAARILAQWNGEYTRNNGGAALFEQAMINLRGLTWDELNDSTGHRVATPSDAIMLELLHQPNNKWWDDRRTAGVVETRDVIMSRALMAAYNSLAARLGPPTADGWPWDSVAKVDINHLLGLKGFSDTGLITDGGRGTLNPAPGGGGFGPSWRLVVDLGPTIQAWDTYPGGQSGNPASAEYDDRIPQWLAGQLSPVLAPESAAALPAARTQSVLVLKPEARQ